MKESEETACWRAQAAWGMPARRSPAALLTSRGSPCWPVVGSEHSAVGSGVRAAAQRGHAGNKPRPWRHQNPRFAGPTHAALWAGAVLGHSWRPGLGRRALLLPGHGEANVWGFRIRVPNGANRSRTKSRGWRGMDQPGSPAHPGRQRLRWCSAPSAPWRQLLWQPARCSEGMAAV